MPLVFGRTSTGLMVPVLVDASGNVQVDVIALPSPLGTVTAQNYGWIASAWQKNPLMFGYSSKIRRAVGSTTLAAGNNTLNDSAVPAGEVWFITNLTWVYTGTSPTQVAVQIFDGATVFRVYNQLAPVSAQQYDRQGFWPVGPGENLRIVVVGATLNDDLNFDATGFAMDIDQ